MGFLLYLLSLDPQYPHNGRFAYSAECAVDVCATLRSGSGPGRRGGIIGISTFGVFDPCASRVSGDDGGFVICTPRPDCQRVTCNVSFDTCDREWC